MVARIPKAAERSRTTFSRALHRAPPEHHHRPLASHHRVDPVGSNSPAPHAARPGPSPCQRPRHRLTAPPVPHMEDSAGGTAFIAGRVPDQRCSSAQGCDIQAHIADGRPKMVGQPSREGKVIIGRVGPAAAIITGGLLQRRQGKESDRGSVRPAAGWPLESP